MYFGTKPGKINPGYLKAGRKNIWVSEADDPPFGAGSFALITDDPAELSKAFDFGNWYNGTAFIYRDTAAGTEAAFIEQGEAERASYLAGAAEQAARSQGDEAATAIWAERRMRLAGIAADIDDERDHYAWQARR